MQQQVRFFEAREIPLDLILLIDTSSSMRDKMSVVQEAAVGFLKTLKTGRPRCRRRLQRRRRGRSRR